MNVLTMMRKRLNRKEGEVVTAAAAAENGAPSTTVATTTPEEQAEFMSLRKKAIEFMKAAGLPEGDFSTKQGMSCLNAAILHIKGAESLILYKI